MIIKIEDTYINLDKVQYILPFKDAKGSWIIKVQFAPSGYIHIGAYSNKDIADKVIHSAKVVSFPKELGSAVLPQ